MSRQFFETKRFMNDLKKLGCRDEDIKQIKISLALDPRQGEIIPNCGDAREYKVILDTGTLIYIAYFCSKSEDTIYLVFMQSEKICLTEEYKAIMRRKIKIILEG